jgi:peptidoglycan hydrolase-like protein with peptidoglycan-binding domain
MSTNGKLPQAELARIFAPGLTVYLQEDAAAAWNSMALLAATRKDLATPTVKGPISAYRTYDQQVEARRIYGTANSATPGESNHGWGLAVDVPDGVRHLIDVIGAQFGFAKSWSDATWEPWHIKYESGHWKVRPDPGIDRDYPVLREGSGGPGQDVWVKRVQKALGKSADGSFGKATKLAVQDFQDQNNLGSSGVVDKRTWIALKKEDK